MKNRTIFLLCAFFLAFATRSHAQDNVCETGYMPFKEGLSFEMTNYGKKGKVLSSNKSKVASLDDADDGFIAVVETETFDKKGESFANGSYTMKCSDGIIYLDMSAMLDPQAMAGFSSMEAEISGNALEIPNHLSVGQILPDGTMEMKISSGGVKMITIRMSITNRKVEAEETITTAAGSFDCIKMSQESELKMLIKKKFKTVIWYAKGVGMVRSENYNSKGKIESYSELTKFEK
jgi:uncharacterized protein DUF3108